MGARLPQTQQPQAQAGSTGAVPQAQQAPPTAQMNSANAALEKAIQSGDIGAIMRATQGVSAAQPGQQTANQNAVNASGLNMMTPGAGEAFWNQHGGYYTQPTAGQTLFGEERGLQQKGLGENYAGEQAIKYQGGTPQMTQNSQTNYQNFMSQIPNIAQDPGLTPYYQNAEANTTAAIDQAMAARGMNGSSAATGEIAKAVGGLEAEKAGREAQYNLARLGEQRAWLGQGGALAGQADTMSNAASQNQLNWMQGLGGLTQGAEGLGLARTGLYGQLAGQADQSGLARMNSGMGAALGSQGAQENRGQNYFGNEMALGGAYNNTMGDVYNPMLHSDQTNFENQMTAMNAAATEAQNQSEEKHGLGGFMSGILGGGGGFSK